MSTKKKAWIGLGAVVASALAAGTAFAGYKTESAYCKKNKDGSGYCYGTFRGFRNNVDPGASVHFERDAFNVVQFTGFLNGSVYQCVEQPGFIGADLMQTILTATGGFSVTWDSLGRCNNISIANDSAFREY